MAKASRTSSKSMLPAAAGLLLAVLAWRGGLTQGQALFAAAWLLAFAVFWGRGPGGWDALDRWGGAFLLSLAPSVLFSLDKGESVRQWLWLLGAWAVACSLRRAAWAPLEKALPIAMAALGAASAFFAVRAWHPDSNPLQAIRPFFPNQNLFAGGLLVPGIFVAWTRMKAGTHGPAWALLAALLMLGLFAAGSRGAWLAFLAGGAWMGLRNFQGFRRSGAFFMLAIALLLALRISPIYERFQANPMSGSHPYFWLRPSLWKQAASLGVERPLAGWGLGAFDLAMKAKDFPAPAVEGALGRYRLDLEHAHQEYLELFAEAGLAPLLLILFLIPWTLWRWWKSRPSPAASATEAILVALLAQALVDFNFHCPAVFSLAVLAFAFRESAPYGVTKPGHSRWLLLPMALLLSDQAGLLLQRQAGRSGNFRVQTAVAALLPLDAPAQLNKAALITDGPGAEDNSWAAFACVRHALFLSPGQALYRLHAASLMEHAKSSWPESHPWGGGRWKAAALAEFERAVASWPFHAPLRLERGLFSLRQSEPAEARGHFEAAVRIEPDYAFAWEQLARLAEKSGDRKQLGLALDRLEEIRTKPFEADNRYSVMLRHADWEWVSARRRVP